MILCRWAPILFVPFLLVPAHALTIDASLSGFDTAETRVFESVFNYWEQTIADSFTVGVSFTKASLTGDTLSFSSGFLPGTDGLPVSASVHVDDRAGSVFGWFVDPTPGTNEEFVYAGDPSYLEGRRPGPAGQDYDLLTILHHEMAHVLGFSTFYPRFASKVGPSDIGSFRKYQGASFATILTPEIQGTHLSQDPYDSYAFHANDLMTSFQSRGRRQLPSALDLLILSDAFGYDVLLPPTPIPEPLPFGLTAGSLVLLALYRRTCARCPETLDLRR